MSIFATGKNGKPSRAKFHDWQLADRLLSQFFFTFSALGLGKPLILALYLILD